MKPNIDDFFFSKNTINELTEEDYKLVSNNYLTPLDSFARITYKSIYVIDYARKQFDYVSPNPLFLCGKTPDEVKKLSYLFYLDHVDRSELNLLIKINKVGFDFYDKLPIEDRLSYTISYDFKLNIDNNKTLVNQKLTPIFLTAKGKIWKSLCVISLSSNLDSGNIKIYKEGENVRYNYNLKNNCWDKEDKKLLNNREVEILKHSAKGLKVKDIADLMYISSDTVKFHRKKLFEKLEVTNITEAIFFATNNKLL